MLQGMTAHYLTHSSFPLKKGDTCLIHAAAGGAGGLAVQMAKMLGATVYGTAGTDEKAEIAKSAGADEVIVYTRQDFVAEVKKLTNGKGVDVVYDSVGVSTFLKGLDLIRPRGMMVLFGQSSGAVPPFDPSMLNQKGSLFLTRPSLAHHCLTREELLWRRAMCWAGSARANWNCELTRPMRWGDAPQAHRDLEGRKTAGKSLAVTFQRPLLLLHVRTAAEIKAGKDPCAAIPADFGVKLPPRPHHAQNGGSGWLLNEAPVHCIVKDGDPGEAIQEAIAECHPCILVAGVKRMSGTRGPHGTAFALLTVSRVPVLCVPPEATRVEVEQLEALPVGAL